VPDGLSPNGPDLLLLTTDAVGGVWRYSLDLASGLAARGVRPIVAVLGPTPDAAQRHESEAAGIQTLETGLALDWTAETPDALADTVAELRRLATRVGATSTHLHAPALAGAEPWPVPVVTVAHSCVATWWRAVRGGELPPDFRWRTEATAAGLRTANAVIAPTQAHADAITACYGPHAIAVVHNGAGRPAISGERRPAVLTAGRLWDEGKNAAALDQVAPALDVPVRAAGPMIGPNGASAALPNLDLLGTLDPASMVRAYTSATVFASLARYEPFGLSVLEAALAGMRLVLSDIPSFRELWDGAAIFVRNGDDPLPALRQALAASHDGRALARARRYTIDSTVEGTLAVHRRVGVRV
jgi:glycosyltransferase involved in cell wall biosynthesis